MRGKDFHNETFSWNLLSQQVSPFQDDLIGLGEGGTSGVIKDLIGRWRSTGDS
jgi:hypothetical protein